MAGYWMVRATAASGQNAAQEYVKLWKPIAEKYQAKILAAGGQHQTVEGSEFTTESDHLAGGMLTGKHAVFMDKPEAGRFDNNESCQSRYWKSDYFAALKSLTEVCEQQGISLTEAALGWLCHHSCLSDARSDSIILGAGKMAHLKENILSISGRPLNDDVLDLLDCGWDTVKAGCFKYFRTSLV